MAALAIYYIASPQGSELATPSSQWDPCDLGERETESAIVLSLPLELGAEKVIGEPMFTERYRQSPRAVHGNSQRCKEILLRWKEDI